MQFNEVYELLEEVIQCGIRKPRRITISCQPAEKEKDRRISEEYRLVIDPNEMTEAAFNCIRMIVQVRKLRFRWSSNEKGKTLEIYSPAGSSASN